MTRSLFMAFLVVARLAAGVVEQGAGVAQDEALLAELQQVLAKAWVNADRKRSNGSSRPIGEAPDQMGE